MSSSGEDSAPESGDEIQQVRGNQFLDLAAESDGAASGEDEYDEGDEGEEVEEDYETVPVSNDVHSHVTLDQERHQQEIGKMTDYFESKYAHEGDLIDRGIYNDDNLQYESVARPRPPGIKDPKLWLVKCDPGQEDLMVLKLMKRYFSWQRTDSRLWIRSAFSVPTVKGYVYIEAMKKVHVEKAIMHLRALKAYAISLIPIGEMTQALTIHAEVPVIKKNQWVRLKRPRTYRGDLALVMGTYDQATKLDLKMMPRIDWAYLEERRANLDNPDYNPRKRKRSNFRPLPGLFNETEIMKLVDESDLKRQDGFIHYKSNKFKGGFLYKRVQSNAVVSIGVTPTQEEIDKFLTGSRRINSDGELEEDDFTSLMPPPQKKKIEAVFYRGDRVIVTEGAMKNLTGTVMLPGTEELAITPDKQFNPSGTLNEITINTSYIRKLFEAGEHVKVLEGPHQNETGLIVRVDDGVLIVFSDIGKEELTVASDIVMITTEVSAGRESLGTYDLYDLVEIGQGNVGCVVRVELKSFKILNTRGQVLDVPLQQMGQKKRTKFAVTFDPKGNPMTRDDVVRITQGPHQGRQCTVKHVYRSWVYLYSFTHNKNSGVLVTRNQHLSAVGRASAQQSSFQQREGRGGGHGFGGGHGRRDRFRNDPLLNQRVSIAKGAYKGMIGLVLSVTQSTVAVELHAVMKTVTVPRVDIREIASKQDSSYIYDEGAGGRTPAVNDLGSRTPYNDQGGMTPMTPYMGDQTPSHSAYTPSHNDMWNPVTPRHPGDEAPTSPRDDWDGGYDSWSGAASPKPTTPHTMVPTTPRDDAPTPNPITPYGDHPDSPTGNPITPYDGQYMAPTTPYDEYPQDTEGPLPGCVVIVDGETAVVLGNDVEDHPYANRNDRGDYEVQFDNGNLGWAPQPLQLAALPDSMEDAMVIAISGASRGTVGKLTGGDQETGESIVQPIVNGSIATEMMMCIKTTDLAYYRGQRMLSS